MSAQPTLREIQQRMAACVMQPLTRTEDMRRRMDDGSLTEATADAIIKPNDRLSSFERLEIYNRQYWYRIFSSFEEDFPGLHAVVGAKKFQALMRAYLEAHPSTSFTLRNLGSKLVEWLRANPAYTAPDTALAVEMAALEWAHIQTFDEAHWPALTTEQMQSIGEDSQLTLQPYLQLLSANHAVDDALIAVRRSQDDSVVSSNNASTGHTLRRRSKVKAKAETIYIAVHRHEDTVYYRRIVREDFLLLSALREGRTLGEAIEAAFATSSILEQQQPAHLQSAFAYWTTMGWFCNPPAETI